MTPCWTGWDVDTIIQYLFRLVWAEQLPVHKLLARYLLIAHGHVGRGRTAEDVSRAVLEQVWYPLMEKIQQALSIVSEHGIVSLCWSLYGVQFSVAPSAATSVSSLILLNPTSDRITPQQQQYARSVEVLVCLSTRGGVQHDPCQVAKESHRLAYASYQNHVVAFEGRLAQQSQLSLPPSVAGIDAASLPPRRPTPRLRPASHQQQVSNDAAPAAVPTAVTSGTKRMRADSGSIEGSTSTRRTEDVTDPRGSARRVVFEID